MAEPFKKKNGNFVSYTGNFTEAPIVDSVKKGNPQIHKPDTFSSNPIGSQSDTKLESHTRGDRLKSDIDKNVNVDDHFIRFVGEKKGESIDKIAEKTTRSEAGDGANFNFSYTKNGKLSAKVELAIGKDRTSSGTFSGKVKTTGRFIEKSADTYNALFKSTGEEEIDAIFDTKATSLFRQVQKKHLKKSRRYHSVKIGAKRDIKQLRNEIKAEQKLGEHRIHDAYFNKSASSFSSTEDKFSQFTETKFDKSVSKEDSGDIFLASKQAEQASIGKDGKKSSYKFEDGTPESNVNTNSNKTSDFNKINEKNVSNREMNKQEALEQKKAEKKAAEKQEKKEVKRAAAAAAVSRMLETKKNISKELRGEQELTGDLLHDGNSGLTRALYSNLKKSLMHGAKSVLSDLGRKLVKIFCGLMSFILPYVLVFIAVMFIVGALISFIGGLFHSDDGALSYELNTTPSGYYIGTPYTSEEIQEIIDYLYEKYPSFSSAQEQVIRSALSAVGCAYDQNSHSNHNDDIWDCSELAYCSCLSAGVDISNGGIYTAAEECRHCVESGFTLEGEFTLQPGDIIFYGGSENGRYLGVYHVSIYLGNIDGVDRMVEAYGTSRGVIVSDVRNQNKIVNISRVL